jgi:Chalcone isomerase-like
MMHDTPPHRPALAAPGRLTRRQATAGLAALPLALSPALGWGQTAGDAAGGAMDVSGVRFEPTATVAGKALKLNGAGTRYKLVFKVYAAGLYLSQPARTTEAVLAAPGPKRLLVSMLREIDANELGKLFVKGMSENATREENMKAIGGTLKMGELFAARKRLKVGESFSVDYLPGTGTTILINDRQEFGPVAEPEFFSALIKIWLGNAPADFKLKEALLGIGAR